MNQWSLSTKLTLRAALVGTLPAVVLCLAILQNTLALQELSNDKDKQVFALINKAKSGYLQSFAAEERWLDELVAHHTTSLAVTSDAQRAFYIRDLVEKNPRVYEATFSINNKVHHHSILQPQSTVDIVRVTSPASQTPHTIAATLTLAVSSNSANRQTYDQMVATHSSATTDLSLVESNTRLLLLLAALLMVVCFVLFLRFAKETTYRIQKVSQSIQSVANGDLSIRTVQQGDDELSHVSRSFNQMIHRMQYDRREISYLQRIGAWQDVARKLAHEIKNPLTPIRLAVEQCVSSYATNRTDPNTSERFESQLNSTAEIVTEEIENLERLVDTFRTLGQLPQVEAKPLQLDALVTELANQTNWKELITVVPPPHPLLVNGDRLLLRRVLTNLIENAKEAGQEASKQGAVTISWAIDAKTNEVVLLVEDEGKGVPYRQRSSIFEPYATTKQDGTGLGLAISKKFILEHRGMLILSPKPSSLGGACFEVRLPLANPIVEVTDN